MKYNNIAEFMSAVQRGEFTGEVVVDNDCVNAYMPASTGSDDETEVYDFSDNGPEGALVLLLQHLNINAGRA